MFLGNHEASFDAKNRVNFPAKLRDKVPESERRSLILAWHPPDPCLVLYTQSEWKRIQDVVDAKSRAADDWDRDLDRHLYGHALDVELDGVGRLLVPEKLKRWAGLEKDVTFVGVRDRIELWDRERWDAEEEKRIKTFVGLRKQILK
jgi:MraZ protein